MTDPVVMLRRCSLLLALFLVPAAPAVAEPVAVPGGPESIRRLLGLREHQPGEDFILEVSRLLHSGSDSSSSAGGFDRRSAVASFAADLDEWRERQGCPAQLSTRPEAWDATRRALLTFGTNVVGFTPFSTDRGPAQKALEDARVSGETALYDATSVALRRLREAGGRRAVVLFTDGENNRSRMSIDQVIDLARATEASVFAVAQVSADVKALLRGLDRLAQETGGRAWTISTIRKLPGVFRAVVAELENQYFLTFTPVDQRPRTWPKVEVRMNRPGLTVRARKSFRIE